MIRRNQVTAWKKRLSRNAGTQFWELKSCKQKVFQRWATGPRNLLWRPPSIGTRLKWPGREADHLCLSNTEVRNEWSCSYTPPFASVAWTVTTRLAFPTSYLLSVYCMLFGPLLLSFKNKTIRIITIIYC